MALIGTTTISELVNENQPTQGRSLFNPDAGYIYVGGRADGIDNQYDDYQFQNAGGQDFTKYKQFEDNSIFGTEEQFNELNTFNGFYLLVGEEIIQITDHKRVSVWAQEDTGARMIRFDLDRGHGGTNALSHTEGTNVEFHDSFDSVYESLTGEELLTEEEEFEQDTQDSPVDEQVYSTTTMENIIFQSESFSTGFGVDNDSFPIEQTLFQPFDAFRARDIDLVNFSNTRDSVENIQINRDGRITLGMYFFEEENIADMNFPNILSAPFSSIGARNIVNNGDCKFVDKNLIVTDSGPLVIEPQGNWQFLSCQPSDRFGDNIYQLSFPNSGGGKQLTGTHAYCPLSLATKFKNESDWSESGGGLYNYWVDGINAGSGDMSSADLEKMFLLTDVTQETINESFDNSGYAMAELRLQLSWKSLRGISTISKDLPHIASWILTDEAYSNNRCLCFINTQRWNFNTIEKYVSVVNGDEKYDYPFNHLANNSNGSPILYNGEVVLDTLTSDNTFGNEDGHQYRVLNQVQKIYDKFNDSPINPYSSLKIRFKMKTTHVFPPANTLEGDELNSFRNNPLDESLNMAPEIEIGVLSNQWEETPQSYHASLPDMEGDERFKTPGGFNSTRYYLTEDLNEQAGLNIPFDGEAVGGATKFKNSIMNEWETFEFTFNLTERHNNKGLIYGVPYGGSFDDESNEGPVEIMLNHHFKDQTPTPNNGEIFFKVPGYQESNSNDRPDSFKIISPDGIRRTVRHGSRTNTDYMTVVSGLGDTDNVDKKTGLQSDGKFIEAYLMYASENGSGNLSFPMESGIGYGGTDENTADIIVAYWDGSRWSYDDNDGYDATKQFTPDETCFIIARIYATTDADGITGIDQYISNTAQYPTDGVGNLHLFLQSGNNFQGRVLIDDIECFESQEFFPDVDVRKRKSVGEYGIADLTKYYDKELQPEEYKDSQAPLEAQFYFYPTYPTDGIFNIFRTPMYQEFKMGRFYIYDVDWGDGSPTEFTTQPKQIDENTALYHTYETNGVFEVTGMMLRVKHDDEDNIVGVLHNKRFSLRINVNEGLDEDFEYFGSDGYSFIPYKNTTPIIGGISKQSSYLKKTKRQLGFLNDEKISIEFKNKSDKLKTELALLKMEDQNINFLEVLPNYSIERFLTNNENNINLFNGVTTIQWPGPDLPLTQIPYFPKNGVLPAPYPINIPNSIYKIERIGQTATANAILPYIDLYDQNGQLTSPPHETQWEVNSPPDAPAFDMLKTGVNYRFYVTSNVNGGISWDALPSVNNPIVYKGIGSIREELGRGIGDCDLTSIKYYNAPKSIWELFGFDNEDLNIIGKPDEERYWKNIIDVNTSIFDREGIDINGNIQNGTLVVDTFSQQDWLDNSYYPVLPRYGSDGKFIDDDFPNDKIPFPTQGIVTDENEVNENLLINIKNEKLESDIFNDKSGNDNLGFSISDFTTSFDVKTLRVKKQKPRSIFKTSKQNGAF